MRHLKAYNHNWWREWVSDENVSSQFFNIYINFLTYLVELMGQFSQLYNHANNLLVKNCLFQSKLWNNFGSNQMMNPTSWGDFSEFGVLVGILLNGLDSSGRKVSKCKSSRAWAWLGKDIVYNKRGAMWTLNIPYLQIEALYIGAKNLIHVN